MDNQYTQEQKIQIALLLGEIQGIYWYAPENLFDTYYAASNIKRKLKTTGIPKTLWERKKLVELRELLESILNVKMDIENNLEISCTN